MRSKKAEPQGELAIPKAPRMFPIPAGTRADICNAHKRGGTCRAEVFWTQYDVPVKGGGTRVVRNPISCAVPGGRVPTNETAGRGVSHYNDCVDASLFHKKK